MILDIAEEDYGSLYSQRGVIRDGRNTGWRRSGRAERLSGV